MTKYFFKEFRFSFAVKLSKPEDDKFGMIFTNNHFVSDHAEM